MVKFTTAIKPGTLGMGAVRGYSPPGRSVPRHTTMTKARHNGKVDGAERRNVVLEMYMRGCTPTEIAKRIGVSRQRIDFLIRYKYKFLPQSRYMLEGALAREWMLRHRPAEFRRIVGEAAEQHCDSTNAGKGE